MQGILSTSDFEGAFSTPDHVFILLEHMTNAMHTIYTDIHQPAFLIKNTFHLRKEMRV